MEELLVASQALDLSGRIVFVIVREVVVHLGEGGGNITVSTEEDGLVVDPVGLQVILKVGSLSNQFVADRAAVAGVVRPGSLARTLFLVQLYHSWSLC